MRVAVVGATGVVGREMVRILEEREFPVDDLAVYSSPRSEGRRLTFRGNPITVRALAPESLEGVDLALFSAGADVSREMAPAASAGGTTCIDNSSAFRMDPDVPLVIPEVNGGALDGGPRLIANPNCTTIVTVMAVAALHRFAGLKQMIVSSYQSVSGTGLRAIQELSEQIEKLHGMEEELIRPDHAALPEGEIYGKTIAFNVLTMQGPPDEDDWSAEERKLLKESRKILDAPELEVGATVVRVPVIAGHSAAIFATFSRPISPEEARDALARWPGVEVVDDPERGEYPTPLDAAGRDDVLVGRIRSVPGRDDALLLFACGDNLRKGAALNAIQIAEYLFAR